MFAEVVATDDPDSGLLDGVVIESSGVGEEERKAVLVLFGGDVSDGKFNLRRVAGHAESLAGEGLTARMDAEGILTLGQLTEAVEVGDEANGNAANVGHFVHGFDTCG